MKRIVTLTEAQWLYLNDLCDIDDNPEVAEDAGHTEEAWEGARKAVFNAEQVAEDE